MVLVEEEGPWQQHIDSLGFTPDTYSPYYPLLSTDVVAQLHRQGMRVVPWTVNTPADMQLLLDMEVDGIITDYPNIAVELTRKP